MAEVRLINNLKGILYYLDEPLLDFEIKNRELIRANDLSAGHYFPPELKLYGVTYGNLNEFFERRTMKDGCMLYREHLDAMGMDRFDFDKYITMKNGNNQLDNYWVKFDKIGASSFSDICNQNYPIIDSDKYDTYISA